MERTRNFFQNTIIVAGISFIAVCMATTLFSGCDTPDSTGPADRALMPDSKDITGSENMTCISSSWLLAPDSTKNLYTLNSHATYLNYSVPVPTVISFSICDLDTTGSTFRPRAIVFGPDPNTPFLRNVNVHMSVADAGLTVGDSANVNYKVYRKNEMTGHWEFHQAPTIGTTETFNFKIRYNGTYALALTDSVAQTPSDSVWTSTGVLTPSGGGSFIIRNSGFSAPPGAVTSTVLASLTITRATPEGLAHALPRVYDFSPEGTTFQLPATLSVAFEDAGLDAEDVYPGMIKFYYFDPSSSTWVPQPTQVDWENLRFIVQMSHFSRYGFGR